MTASQDNGRVITKPLHQELEEQNYDEGTVIWDIYDSEYDLVCSPENPLLTLDTDLELASLNNVRPIASIFACTPKTRKTYRIDASSG